MEGMGALFGNDDMCVCARKHVERESVCHPHTPTAVLPRSLFRHHS